uniref:TRAF interacting protein n=1 Tax=Malurus cyaneus samueli TaxID=2593467 RepID=A0A8C5X9V4_9PASS
MPIRAYCTICSDFFDNERDVAAVQCGHTFHRDCLIQWFDTAPSRTCPQCRIQVKPSPVAQCSAVAPRSCLQKTTSELEKTKEELKSTQKDLKNADKEILVRISFLMASCQLLPAPVELQHPKLHRPANSDEIDLDATFDVDTPEHRPCTSPIVFPPLSACKGDQSLSALEVDDTLKGFLPAFIRNSVLSKKPSLGSLLGRHKNMGTVRTGYDGMGGRTKFIQPVSFLIPSCSAEFFL